jgi:pimeloyl-ACP methyl ester carboxylesterase
VSIGFGNVAGTIQVTTNSAAATFTLTGPATYTGSGTSFTQPNASTGTYTITYGGLSGCPTPPPESKPLNGGTVNFTGTYQTCIRITSNIANAPFTISPPVPGFASTGSAPATLPGLPPNQYTVVFGQVSGYVPPPAATIQLGLGDMKAATGSYLPAPIGSGSGTILVSSNVPSAAFTIRSLTDASFPVINDNTGATKLYQSAQAVPPGVYKIDFADRNGYFTPASQTLTLNQNSSISFAVVYRRVLVVLFTGYGQTPQDGSSAYPLVVDPALAQVTGMLALADSIRNDSDIKQAVKAKVFTFYSKGYDPSGSATLVPGGLHPELHKEAEDWLLTEQNATSDDHVVVMGYSYGGNRARLFAQQLASKGFTVDGLTTVDPIDWSVCSFEILSPLLCIQSSAPRVLPDGTLYVLSYNQTSSEALQGYYFSQYPHTTLNDFGCLQFPGGGGNVNPKCPHVMIDVDPRVRQAGVDFVKGIGQSSAKVISSVSVSNLSANGATVSWTTLGVTTSGLGYSLLPTVPGGSPTAADYVAANTHTVQLSGLTANTTYYFKIVATRLGSSIDVYSPVMTFRTQPATLPVIRASNASLTISGGLTRLKLTLTNIGAPATGGQLLSATIGTVKTTVPVPLPIPDLGTGASFNPDIPFPTGLGASGAQVVATVTVQYNGLKFPLPVRVTLP